MARKAVGSLSLVMTPQYGADRLGLVAVKQGSQRLSLEGELRVKEEERWHTDMDMGQRRLRCTYLCSSVSCSTSPIFWAMAWSVSL